MEKSSHKVTDKSEKMMGYVLEKGWWKSLSIDKSVYLFLSVN